MSQSDLSLYLTKECFRLLDSAPIKKSRPLGLTCYQPEQQAGAGGLETAEASSLSTGDEDTEPEGFHSA